MEVTELDLIDKEEQVSEKNKPLHRHPYLERANRLIYVNLLDKAESLCELFECEQPDSAEVLLVRARIAGHSNKVEESIAFEKAYLTMRPDDVHVRIGLIQKLQRYSFFEEAFEHLEFLKKTQPLQYLSNKAELLRDTSDLRGSLACWRKIIKTKPDNPKAYLRAGDILRSIGRTDDAVKSYKQALTLQPGLGGAYFALANSKSYQFSPDEIAEMVRIEKLVNFQPQDYFSLCYTLGKAFEDAGDYDASFKYYKKANDTKAGQEPYEPEVLEAFHQEQQAVFTETFFEERKGWGCQAADPIFIVGLPRSGTTLLEQILSSHKEVDACGELSDIIHIAMSFAKPGSRYDQGESGYVDTLKNMTKEQALNLGNRYLDKVSSRRKKGRYFVDKMPNNFHCVALIKLILPNAKIIDARRHPMSVGLANYRQSFPSGLRFTNQLENIGRYYGSYVNLLEHFDKVLPDFILRSSYENLVQDSERSIRRLLDYCGLKFDKKCLNFHKTKREIRTPSAAQVRQPMYSSEIEKWRKYEKHLGPLAKGLQIVLDKTTL